MPAQLPKLHSLKEAVAALDGKISVGSLRAAVRSGALKCIRAADSCSAKILIAEGDLARRIDGLRGKAQVVHSPAAVKRPKELADSAEAEAS